MPIRPMIFRVKSSTCSIDGDLLPKIFLCGTNDSQPIKINITDAQSLSWEKLDEASCSAAPDDCANKNLGCSWTQLLLVITILPILPENTDWSSTIRMVVLAGSILMFSRTI